MDDGLEPTPNFPDGSITKIVYHNFLTYDNVVCRPGPNLNVFIGTNGAGKSTVICGICLAVGGNPKVLGRSERMGDYIKHKRDEGYVELYIADSQKGEQSVKILLERPNSCTYFINGSRSTQKAVRELVASYNIQIDNPCTFLAQDKVKSFSEQSPVDLLMNTERAGDIMLMEKHEELIKKKKQESVHIENARVVQLRLQSIEGEISALLPRAENYKKKEFMRTKIRILQKKKAVMEFNECEERFSIEEAAMDRLQSAVKETDKQIEQLRKKNEKKANQKEEYTEKHNDAVRNIHKITDEINTLKDRDLYEDKVRNADERFRRLKAQNDNWEIEMEGMKKQVERVRENLAEAKEELKGYEKFKDEAARKAQKLAEDDEKLCHTEEQLQSEERKLTAERNKIRDEERNLERAMEGRVRALENLRSNMADEAWRWYQANRSKFRHPVHVPILHMTVPDAKSAMLLENLIAVRDLQMFIFGCKEDEALLTDRKHQWKLNSTVIPPSQVAASDIDPITQQMKGFGFTRFAANLFTAPDVVKHYLCNVSRLHQVPIGTARTNDLYDDIKSAFAGSPYKLYLTDKYRVQFTVSRYGSHEILGQQNELRTPARLLTAHSTPLEENGKFDEDKQRLRDLEKGLIDRRNELNRGRANIHKEKEELKVKQSEWRNRRDNVTNLERSLNNRENKLEMLSANRPDIEQARAALLETKRMASRAVHELAMKIISKLEAMRKICTEETLLRVTLESLRNTVSEDQEKLQELEEKRNEDLALIEGGLTTFRNAKKDLERAQEALFEHCGLKSLDVSKMTAADKKIWKLLNQMFIDEHVPDDKPSLLRLLEEEKVKLDIASKDGSKEDVDRCERLQREKTALLERKEQQEVSRETWRATMMKEIAEWRTPIEELISRINTNYSNFFAVLGCAGEVYLDVPEDPHDIANYGIMIMVSFRSGERLKRLDHQVQSGGERSVATMLYLLALQELCPVPFRCVDEINQGMDPVNERKVFEIMVDTLSGEGNLAKTQYFLLTPKLLHGLKFNRKVTVQIVHNGATLSENCHEWDARNFLSIMKSRTSC